MLYDLLFYFSPSTECSARDYWLDLSILILSITNTVIDPVSKIQMGYYREGVERSVNNQ